MHPESPHLISPSAKGFSSLHRFGRWISIDFRRFFAVFLVLVVIAAFRSEGWNQPDEHARILEPAHKIVYGYATLPWELGDAKPCVSYLMGFIHSAPLYLSKALGWTGQTEAFILRTLSGLVNSTRVAAFFLILGLMGVSLRWRGILTGLYALGPFGLVLVVRTTQENWASTALLWGVYFFMRAELSEGQSTINIQTRLKTRKIATAGFFIGLAASFRFQTGVCALAIWIYSLRRFHWKESAVLTVAILIGLAPLALVDTYFTGHPFLPAYNYFKYALSDEDGGTRWGTDSWDYYILGFFTTVYPPYSLALVPLMIKGMQRFKIFIWTIVPFTIVHFILGHKEHRYFFPIFPFFFLAATAGYMNLKVNVIAKLRERWSSLWRPLPMYAWLSVVVGLVFSVFPLNPAPRLYQHLGDLEKAGKLPNGYTYVANSMSSVALFYTKSPDRLPVKIDIDTFVTSVEDGSVQAGTYAIYRIDTFTLHEVEKSCRLEFTSFDARVRALIEWAKPVLRKTDVDAVVYCPGKE